MYTLPELTEEIIALAEKNLPKFSGQNKLLEVLIKFYYGSRRKSFRSSRAGIQHVKIAFWHPNNAMLVAHSFAADTEAIGKNFTISANHSSTWKYDGLNFFYEIFETPRSWKILSAEVIEVENIEVAEYFNYSPQHPIAIKQ